MNCVDWILKNPVSVYWSVFLLTLLSIIALPDLPVRLLPSLDTSRFHIIIRYPSANPDKVHDDLKPLFDQLRLMNDLENIEYRISENRSDVSVVIKSPDNEQLIIEEIRMRIDRLHAGYPEYFEQPVILAGNHSDSPDFRLLITGNVPFEELCRMAEIKWLPELKLLEGIAFVDFSGLLTQKTAVIPLSTQGKFLNAVELIKNGLTDNARSENLTLILQGRPQAVVSYRGRQRSPPETWLRTENGRMIRMSNLAISGQTLNEPDGIHYYNGRRALAVNIYIHDGANLSKTGKHLQIWKRRITEQSDISVDIVKDHAEILRENFKGMLAGLFFSIAGVVLIFVVFAENVRIPLMIALTLFVVLILSNSLFRLTHTTLNIISLSGLILGTGLLIDNTIVILESIMNYHQRYPVLVACKMGINDTFRPLMGSNLTTVGACLPLIVANNPISSIFREEAIAIVLVILLGVLTSYTILPVCYSQLFARARLKKAGRTYSFISGWISRFALRSQEHPVAVLTLFFLIIVAGSIAIIYIDKETDPVQQRNSWTLKYQDEKLPELAGLQFHDHQLEISSGKTGFLKEQVGTNNQLTITGPAAEEISVQLGKSYAVASVPAKTVFTAMFNSSQPDVLVKYYLKNGKLPSFAQRMIKSKKTVIIPQNVSRLYRSVTRPDWQDATTDIPVSSPYMKLESGQQVHRQNIEHQVMTSHQSLVTGDLKGKFIASAYSEAEFLHRGKKELAQAINEGIPVEIDSKKKSELEHIIGLTEITAIAVLVLFILLVLQFNSLSWPLIIIMVIPIGISGSLLALGMTGQTLNLMSGTGIIAMLGISVNDSILKISAIMRAPAVQLSEALRYSLAVRLKPILMTSATTIISCFPILCMPGYGNDVQRPLAVAMIGGIIFSTLAALFFIPAAVKLLSAYGVLILQPTGRTSA